MANTLTAPRRIADGTYNLRDLRRLIAADNDVDVHPQGGQWIVSRWCEGYGRFVETPLHYSIDDERSAITVALRLDEAC